VQWHAYSTVVGWSAALNPGSLISKRVRPRTHPADVIAWLEVGNSLPRKSP